MKKFLKKLLLFVLMFLVVTYFIGSCTERPAEPASENSTPAYTELTPDEYQKQMDELLKRQPVTQTAFKSPMLSVKALDVVDKLDEWFDKTNFYDAYDFIKGYYDYLKNPDYYPEDDYIPPVKGKSTSENPVTSYENPLHYNAYGKFKILYNGSNTSEIITNRFDADLSVDGKPAKGHVTITRISSAGYTTSFGFDVKLTKVVTTFNVFGGFDFQYKVVDSNVKGIDRSSTTWQNILKSNYTYVFFFTSRSTNDIRTISTNATYIAFDSFLATQGSTTWNTYTVSQTFTNDYSFNTSIDAYQNNNSYSRSVNVYYNNRPNEVVTVNNYNEYKDYGYTYNDITGSLEIDPDILANYFNNSIKPSLDLKFDDLFSAFPDIGATIKNYTGELNNLIVILNETTTTGTYPVATGEVNVNVSVIVTFPEEKKYPAFTTEPAFVAENPDVDFALDSPLPVRALETAGGFITLASDFIEDSGLMPIVLMSVSLGFVAMFFL